MTSHNLLSHFIITCQKYPKVKALDYAGGHYTWSQLNKVSNQLAWSLIQLGVKPGDHIGVFLPNIPETLISFLGILKAGAVHVSMSGSLKSNGVGQILENSRPRVLITTQALKELVPQDLPFLEKVLAIGPDASLDSLLDGSSVAPILWPVRPEHLALILYTSGTTGVPKGVTHCHSGLTANMKNFAQCIEIQQQDRVLWFLPLSHDYALNAVLSACFYTGACLYLLPDFQSEKVLQWISVHRITMIFGVPANFAMLKNANSQMDSVRLFYSSGASLPIPLSREWEARFGRCIHQSYGLSECGICTYQYAETYEHGSLGGVIEPMEIKVVDPESGLEQPRGQQGELIIRGPNIMRGYWNRPEENAAAIRNGWYHSGDIGVCDSKGHFKLLGRLKLVGVTR